MIPMKNKNEYAERPILKVLDVPDHTQPGSTLWHISNLCGVLGILLEESPEYNYIKAEIEQRILEHERDG